MNYVNSVWANVPNRSSFAHPLTTLGSIKDVVLSQGRAYCKAPLRQEIAFAPAIILGLNTIKHVLAYPLILVRCKWIKTDGLLKHVGLEDTSKQTKWQLTKKTTTIIISYDLLLLGTASLIAHFVKSRKYLCVLPAVVLLATDAAKGYGTSLGTIVSDGLSKFNFPGDIFNYDKITDLSKEIENLTERLVAVENKLKDNKSGH